MKISVVIPAFNEEKFITACLKSLQNQTEKPDEIIVIDNNSTDNTVKLAQQFPVRIVKEKKQGIIFSRNCGFDKAKYEIIARCDADTILPKNWVKKIKENFKKNNLDALSGPIIYYDLKIRSKIFSEIYLNFLKFVQKGETLIGMNMVISNKYWQKIKNEVCFEEKRVHEDVDLAIHILKSGGVIKRDNTLVVKSSARRILKNPFSFFCEYPIRLVSTFLKHR